MQNQLLSLFLGQNNQAVGNLMAVAQSAGLIDIAMQGYQAYKLGKLPEFVSWQYENNIAFRKFYDTHKKQTLEEFMKEKNIIIDDDGVTSY